MANAPTAAIEEHSENVEDPRVPYLVIHPLINIFTIALCAIIAGADSWSEVATFGQRKKEWLSQYLELKMGTPSHDTFSTVFGVLDPRQLQDGFISWVQAIYQRLKEEVVAVDGKMLRHSFDTAQAQPMITMVSAWATEAELVLGQLKVAEGSNEITAIPQLFRLPELNDCSVTVDAIGCQKEIAEEIVAQGADYLLAVKSNQEQLHEDIELFFRLSEENGFAKVEHTYQRIVNKGHGRIEVRQCWAISGEESLQFLRGHQDWPRLQTIVRIDSQRHVGNQVSQESRFFISSLPNDAKHLLQVKRSHWTISSRSVFGKLAELTVSNRNSLRHTHHSRMVWLSGSSAR